MTAPLKLRTILKSNGRGTGWKPDRPSHKDWTLGQKLGDVPQRFSTNPQLDKDYFPAIRDQGELGSCTGFALRSAMAYLMRKRYPDKLGGDWGKTWDLSPLAAYYLARERDNSTDVDVGAYIRDVVDGARVEGIPTEASWPYDIRKFRRKPSDRAYKEGLWHQADKMATYRCDEEGSTRHHAVDRILQALEAGLPVVFGFTCFSNLSEADSTGYIRMPGRYDREEGGHAIVAFGADTRSRHLWGPNSWSEQWGDGGYWYLPFDYVLHGYADDFWAVDLEQAPA
jgi:C1A family cysteine protease